MTLPHSIIEFGGNLPRTISRIVPPATPVIVAKITIPTMSALFSIALNAPVTANAIVPNRSKMYMNTSAGTAKSTKSYFASAML